MATGLPGTQLPLDPVIQQAMDDFRAARASFLRQAVLELLLEDLKDDLRKLLELRN
jgi:hypothetical protein